VEEKEAPKKTTEKPVTKTGELLAELAKTVDEAIKSMQSKLANGETKGVADLIRLLQLRKELAETNKQPSRVTVRWIDEWQKTLSNEE